ncbi:acylamino-acid-releasing enzyme-like isoform X1 [Homarus americanus]|uniref:acylamino-acid-releasing enzyme-like isoform X1 n=3 Tax=Homarus americanus TaxID=6706 RepID=UPI001C469B37|nr:acylamino-acid-releasing enzyme-like isoform X1 [Homarus americanus]XP_042207128.1 acylamino-acid-releasing enzyme-like isoform X1 [Homarus americanus]
MLRALSSGQRLLGIFGSAERFSHSQVTKMVDAYVNVFKEVAQISDLKGAKILNVTHNEQGGNDDVSVQVFWSSRNLTSLERSITSCDYLVQGEKVISFPPSPINKNVVLSQTSASGKWTAFMVTSEKNQEEHQVMVVNQDGSMKTFDLKVADKHGKVYSDGEFGCLEWSADETMLVYVAEKKQPKPTSFMTPLKSGKSEDARGQEFIFRDDWGEQLDGKHQSVVCLLNVNSGDIKCHELRDQLCPGQMVWAPDSAGIFGVAFVGKPYRLGLIYNHNRESKLFHMDLEGNYSVISEGHSNIRSPRVSPDGLSIVFLRTKVGGPHAKCSQLCLLTWPDKQERVVVDVVYREKEIEDGDVFKGIYGYSGLPQRCWLNDSRRIVFSSFKFDNVVSYVFNVVSGTITELSHLGSLQVLDVCDGWLLVDFSYISQPNLIRLGYVPEEGQECKVDLIEVTPRREIAGVPNYYRGHWLFINETPHPDPKYSDIPISVIYFGPTSHKEGTAKTPLICWPHGGPHTVSSNVYNMAAAFFVKLGYAIVFPNYRGSLGFGEDGVSSLPGHCGVTDVSDVHKATLQCLSRFSDVLDESKVFLFGGSHGGYLVTQLAAKYPEVYKAVSARNPVTDISTMTNVTDIPDWTFVETGFPHQHGKVPDGATLSKMLEMSPINHIDSLKAPVLLLVGKNDARVPPSQSVNFYKMLLARGVHTELHLYDDCHPLNKVDSEVDCLIHTALWFEKHQHTPSS